jgi:predicted 3-demethylubiquinone-9 3-methyltransferase (glyoxalase superfamily)
LGLILTFFGFSALRCAMVHYLQIFFDLKIITVKQYGKGAAEQTELDQLFKKAREDFLRKEFKDAAVRSG